MASISYNFEIFRDNVYLQKSTYHEPIRCNGKYGGIEKDSVLQLFYIGEDESCKSESPIFLIRKNNEGYFIQGVGSIATEGDWIKLIKKS